MLFKYKPMFQIIVSALLIFILYNKTRKLLTCSINDIQCHVLISDISKFSHLRQIFNCNWLCIKYGINVQNEHSSLSQEFDKISPCNIYTCTNMPNIFYGEFAKIKVYIYNKDNEAKFNKPLSLQFLELMDGFLNYPEFVTKDPHLANFYFVPYDLLNMHQFSLYYKTKAISQVLQSLPWWKQDGLNHLIWSMLPMLFNHSNHLLENNYLKPEETIEFLRETAPKAILILPYFTPQSYRQGFDISIPIYSHNTMNQKFRGKRNLGRINYKAWFLVNTQTALGLEEETLLSSLTESCGLVRFIKAPKSANPDLYRSSTMDRDEGMAMPYPEILENSTFCLILPNQHLTTLDLSEALMSGCIPVIALKGLILPYAEVLDYSKFAHLVHGNYGVMGKTLAAELASLTPERIGAMRERGILVWKRYFGNMSAILKTVLDILNQRIFPYNPKTYREWNDLTPIPSLPDPNLPSTKPFRSPVADQLFNRRLPVATTPMPRFASNLRGEGFTAVILTYKRVVSLFKTISSLYRVPSLRGIVVVWNNPETEPPPVWLWPAPDRHREKGLLQIVRASVNSLNNRFLPYPQIGTAAIFSIDDDIDMLTADEIEFGFRVWCQYPDRIVGYPSRLHRSGAGSSADNGSAGWTYVSEWSPRISIILTGAAFYHKHFHYLYTNHLPLPIKRHVDQVMNCEDIAMNLLISHVTGNGPIKVLPRQKYKCPKCVSEPALSYDTTQHLEMRSRCLDKFAAYFTPYTGTLNRTLPLRSVEFRMDPLLYKKSLGKDRVFLPNSTNQRNSDPTLYPGEVGRNGIVKLAFKDVNFL